MSPEQSRIVTAAFNDATNRVAQKILNTERCGLQQAEFLAQRMVERGIAKILQDAALRVYEEAKTQPGRGYE